MKQVKFLLEVAGFFSVIPILVFAKLSYTKAVSTPAVLEPVVGKTMLITRAIPGEQPADAFPGLINSKFIIVNY
ncbi:MAG: hypothetical protein V4725_19295 [Bacteroidota bacterium]